MKTISCLLALLALAPFASAQLPSDVPWDVKALEKAPAFEWLDQKEKLHSLTYEAEPYQGHKTKVFAYYATPYTLGIDKEPGKKYPGVIVAHGGMGGAYGGWVEALAKRGYAAIAPCLNGGDKRLPESERGPKDSDDHTIFFPKEEPAIKEYWQYHAVADIILAHSLIRSFPDVDADRTGLWGISWGGFSTGIVSGLDHRFKAMVPMYGCGFYHENGQWAYKFKSAPPDKAKRWVELWDPSSYVGRATAPMMFINGARDSFYPLDSYAKTYALVEAPKNISVQPALHHAHIYNQLEASLFLDQHLRGGVPLPIISGAALRDGKVSAEVEIKTKVKAVQLHWTTGPHKEYSKRAWESKELTLEGNKISGDAPPADATVWLITAQDERDALVSTSPMLR